MDFLFLGTSAGTPTKTRNVTALAIIPEGGVAWYLIDCGEATQHQLLHTPLSLKNLQAICITHRHGDHCYGLPGLIASASMAGRTEPLVIIAPDEVVQWVSATLVLTDVTLRFELDWRRVETLEVWRDTTVTINPTLLSHRVPSYAYSCAELAPEMYLDTTALESEGIPRGPLWGQLKRGDTVSYQGRDYISADYLICPYSARHIIVGGDNDRPELLAEAAISAQVLIHEATYTQDIAEKVGTRVQHSSAAAVAQFAQAAGLRNLVLTHFSPRYQSHPQQQPNIVEIQQEAELFYRGNLFLANDFARFRLARDGVLKVVSSEV